MNARCLAAATAATLSLSAASLTGTAAATPPDGAVSCATNAAAAIQFWITNGYIQPAPPCKPLT